MEGCLVGYKRELSGEYGVKEVRGYVEIEVEEENGWLNEVIVRGCGFEKVGERGVRVGVIGLEEIEKGGGGKGDI